MLLGQAQPQSKRPQSRIVRSAGRKPCLCVPSASPPFSREWLTACLQQTPAGFPRHFYYTDVVDLSQCVPCFCGDFSPFFACFGSDNFLPAPNQHRLFCDLRQEPGNTGPHLLLVICFYIHSKTACRGFKSFCPCQKPAETLRFCRLSFYVLYACGVHAGSDSGFSHPFASARTCFHPLQHPKRTRFCLFSAFPGAFLCFLPFWTCKILGPVFVHCADMPHRLKPSVIPCRREVSFLT